MESWVGPVYLVIFSYWGGPVPYLELFGGGPVKKNTLYIPPNIPKTYPHKNIWSGWADWQTSSASEAPPRLISDFDSNL